jgi:hypothetical protein
MRRVSHMLSFGYLSAAILGVSALFYTPGRARADDCFCCTGCECDPGPPKTCKCKECHIIKCGETCGDPEDPGG